jgi:hypothetical protein
LTLTLAGIVQMLAQSARILQSAGQLLWEQKRLARGHNAAIAKRTKSRRARLSQSCERALKWYINAARLTGVGQNPEPPSAVAIRAILASDADITAWLSHDWLVAMAPEPLADSLAATLTALLGHENTELGTPSSSTVMLRIWLHL